MEKSISEKVRKGFWYDNGYVHFSCDFIMFIPSQGIIIIFFILVGYSVSGVELYIHICMCNCFNVCNHIYSMLLFSSVY